MFTLHIADIIVLVVYFVIVTLIGTWTVRMVTNMGDFFMPRRFGKTLLVTHGFGTGTHADQAVGVASKTFTNGLSGIWYQWLWLFCTPFYWLIAPVMRRFRAITMSDVFTARFSRSVGMLFALVGAFQLMFNMGIMLKGSGAVISASFGETISADIIILIMTAIFVIYGVAGGLSAAIITDFIQGILTVVFSFALVPFVMSAVGGMSGLREKIADPEMFSLIAPGEIGLFYVVVIAFNALVGIVVQPHTMGNCAAGRTEYDGRFGWTVGNFIKRLCTMAWCITGLAAVAYLGAGHNPDHIYGIMAREFFPKILPGLLGVFLAALLASVMSSCDSFMIASSALITENLYKPFLPHKSEKHYITVGRIASFIIVAGGLFSAYLLQSVVQGLEIFWKIASMMGIAFWLGLFWRRTTVAGAWAATLSAFAMWWLTTQQFFVNALGALHTGFTIEKAGQLSIYLPWQMILYLFTGTIVGIFVSLLTKPGQKEQLDRFYELVRTPVNKGEGVPPAPCVIPQGITIPPKRSLFKNSSLEILLPTKISIIGFVISWVAVAVLVYGFYSITR